jgi:hypothetical protein
MRGVFAVSLVGRFFDGPIDDKVYPGYIKSMIMRLGQ